MVKLKAYTIIESMISLAVITAVVLLMSLIFSNILSSDKNAHRLKAQELIDDFENGGPMQSEGLYDLEVKEMSSSLWAKSKIVEYRVFYREGLVFTQRKITDI